MERAGAMRSLASFYDEHRPDVFAICRMKPGDALALATRFSLQWAYRGRQALFWTSAFKHAWLEDPYLPFHVTRPLDRRAFVRIDVERNGQTYTLAETEFARTQMQRTRELRFVRTALRRTHAPAIFFAHIPEQHAKFSDLGFQDASAHTNAHERIYVRGLRCIDVSELPEERGIGAPLIGKFARV